MEAEEAAPLFQQIVTKPKFEDNVDEITFPAPVCLKGIAVGAMPGSIPDGGHAFLNVFARDSRAGGSARFACLYEGLQQPTTGVSVVHIQPFITDHVVLRGRYQTAPITLLGVPLAEAAAQYVPRPETPLIDLEQALPRFEKLVECLPPQPVLFNQQQDHDGKNSANVSFHKDAQQGLEGLLKFWRQVGSSYRRISEATIPKAAFTKAIKAADALCEKLAMGGSNDLVIFEDKDSRTLCIDESELIDMAMGWAGLLADIPILFAANTSISECSSAGIAALLLICTLPSAATTLLARHGHLILADVFKFTPVAPGSQLRHATAACLLIALSNGGAGCEALLGWWSPTFVQWVAPSKKNNPIRDGGKERRHQHRDDSREKHSRREKQREAIIPQVDGAGDEKKRGWHHNKRQRRDGSHDRDDSKQHRRGGGRNNDGRSHHHRDNSSGGGRGGGRWQAIEDDDRWNGGGGDADEYIAYVEEDDEDTRGDRRREPEDARDEERRGGGSGSKERSRDRSAERERGAERDRERGRERERVPITARLGKRRNQSPPPPTRSASPTAVEEKKRNPRGRDDHHQQPEKKKDDLRHQIRASASARSSPPPSTSRGRSPLPKQPPLKKSGKHEQEDVAILHKFTQYWDNRLRHYVGIYSPLATLLLQIQPRTLTVLGTRLMRILRFYEHVTIFSNAAEELTSQYLPSKRSCMPSKEAAVLARKCGVALEGMAEYLAQGHVDSSTSTSGLSSGLSGGLSGNFGLNNEKNSNSGILGVTASTQSTNTVHLTTLIQLMTSRRVHQLLAALVLVPSTHKARSEEEGGDAAMAAADASAAMSIELSLGYRPFLSAITSNVVSFSRSEIRGLVSELLRVLCLPGALDTSLSSALAPLTYFAVALAAVEDLYSSSISSTRFSSAAATLGQLFAGGPSHRIPAVHAVCLNAKKVLPKLVAGVIQRCAVLLEAAGMAAPVKKEQVDKVDDDGDEFGKVLDALPSLEICTDILLAVLTECTSIHVVSALASIAEPMISSLSVAAQDLCGCPVAGAAAVFNAVESICGGFEALSTLHNSIRTVISKENSSNVVESMLKALATDLPPLAPLGVEHFLSSNSTDVDDIHNGGSSMYVDWADIRDFWDNPRRKYRAELSLKLLTMFLWQPTTSITAKVSGGDGKGDSGGNHDNNSGEYNNKASTSPVAVYGRHAAATMQSHDGQRLLLRALVTAGEATAASYSDRQWISRAGAAIDPATAASNKQAALEFLSSTAAMASVFFQHMREMMPIHSTACAAALIQAHAVVSSEEDCLLALLGQANAAACGAAALTARFHLTSALRCWIESSSPSASKDSPWTPELLPLILFGTKHAKRCLKHGVLALPPRQLFTAVCILGDLSPTEWPPAGTRRLFNPPPSFRPYRRTFAMAIEKCSDPFSELISACVNAEPTLLRAAAARMLARAAGFGGGMGEFIIKPILAALQLGTASQTPAHDVRKVLELLVPLVYRPALKAALLDSLAPAILADVLRVMLTGYPFGATAPVPIDPTDASAICTMVLECLVVLCNPQHMLDPQIQPYDAAIDDTLRVEHGKIVASVLLEFLSSFGVNIPLAHRVLRLLAENACGRISICRGAAALHAKATQNMDSRASAAEIVAAAQWVATRYWEMAQQAQHDVTVSETYADVVKIMTTTIESMEEDGMVEQDQQRRQQKQELQANKRFVAATYNSIAAAKAAGVDLSVFEHRWEKEIPDPISSAAIIPFESSISANSTTTSAAAAAAAAASDLAIASGIFDPATRMFWTNYRARAVQQTRASTEMVLRKFHRKTCLPDEYFTLADTLHLPLTRPVRPLHEDMEADQEADDEDGGMDGVATLEEDTGPSEVLENEEIKEEERVEIKNETSPLPVAPIVPSVNVPVIAPPTAPAADFDLYADLGADLGIGGGAAAVAAPKTEPSGPTSPVADDPSALLNDPEALKTVLQDPSKMQELLQRNPALLMAMKSKLGKGGDTAKYPDFKVNEIDFGGNVARLTNFDIPPPAAGIARVEDALPSAAAVSTAYETLLGGAAAATKKDDLLAFLEQAKLHKDAASANKAPEPLVLDSLPDKDLRRSVHQLLKNLSWAPPISTKAVTISNPTPGDPELQGIQVICTATDARKSQTGQKRKWQQERQEWPGGKNRFLRFALLKENSDTHHTLISMAKVLHINANVFNVAGTKDKRGVTVQWVTAFSVTPEKLLRINNILRGIRVGNFSYVPEALRLGDLRGNKFDIVLRGLSAESSDMVEAAAAALKTTGFINYYGLQRFGSSVIPTHHVGKALLRGEWEEAIKCIMTPAPNTKEVITSAIADFLNGGSPSKCLSMLPRNLVAESAILTVLAKEGRAATVNALLSIPRNLKSMYLHAYQSYIWNEAASERISKFGAEKVVAGDLVVPRSTLQAARSAKAKNATDPSASSNASEDVPDEEVAAEPHVVTEEEAALNTFSIEDLVLPLPGRKIVYPKNEIAQIYENLMEKDGISMTTPATKVKEFSQEAMPGGYRHVLFKPKDLEYSVLRYDDKETELAQTDADVLNGVPPLVLPENGKYLALRLAFSLPSSTYATMLIRELTKMPTSVEFSKGLQHPE